MRIKVYFFGGGGAVSAVINSNPDEDIYELVFLFHLEKSILEIA